CAVPLSDVIETMRPLPARPLSGMPPFVRGLAAIRGEAVPVIDLGSLVAGQGDSDVKRYVTIRSGARPVALGVEEGVGGRLLEPERMAGPPALLHDAGGRLVEAVAALGEGVLMILDGSRLLGAVAPVAS